MEKLSDQQNEEILKALDEAIKNGPWEESNFLRAIGKNLTDIRDNFANHLGEHFSAKKKADFQMANRMAKRSELQEVFISLYSSDGDNLQSWERIINNLPQQMISRPIYEKEEHVQAMIKSKENKLNEAYVTIFINQMGVIALPPDKIMSDKFGSPLLTLKDKTLNLENIGRFVHVSGTYEFSGGRLTHI